MMRPRPLAVSLALIACTLVSGLGLRFAPLGLPHFIVKYGGSTLWALMIYWIVSTVLSSWGILWAIAISGAVASAVEGVKLYHSPGLDAFRLTLLGILLLGRVFSPWNIVAYCIAILVGGFADYWIRAAKRSS
jgi:hypothetical protein